MFELIRYRQFAQELSNAGYSQAFPRLNFCLRVEAAAGPWYCTLMPRPLKNNPIIDAPNYVTEPLREAELVVEFNRKRLYAIRSFRMARLIQARYGTVASSARRAKDAVDRKRGSKRPQTRLHPELEAAMSYKAVEIARNRTGEENPKVINADRGIAAVQVADRIYVKMGRNNDRMLQHHVEGLMALWQETCCVPVTAQQTKNSVYGPHLADRQAQDIFECLHAVDATITPTQIANCITEARKKYAGKRMRFADFFVGYGAKINENGEIVLAAPYRIVDSGINFPTYST